MTPANKVEIAIHPLFYTPVFQINVPEGVLNLESLKNYEFQDTRGDSYNCFASIETSVLADFPPEKNFFCDMFNQVKNDLLGHTTTDFVMTRSWVTKVEKNGIGDWHRHGNNYYSGVFYFDDYNDGSSPIEFKTPMGIYKSFSLEVSEYNATNAKYRSFYCPKNTLIFFPSYLVHRIGLHKSDLPRYSVAFNFHPCGEYGHTDSKIYLNEIK